MLEALKKHVGWITWAGGVAAALVGVATAWSFFNLPVPMTMEGHREHHLREAQIISLRANIQGHRDALEKLEADSPHRATYEAALARDTALLEDLIDDEGG